MKRISLLLSALLLSVALWSQSAREEIRQNVLLSASNYLAYPAPSKALTAAPKGKKPFYLSHYGRHGSRFLIDRNDYDGVISTLAKAADEGKLTPTGELLLDNVRLMSAEADRRLGELTLLGAQQHRQIAHRMFERFPEVFKGDVVVDAKSTVVIRCILSMENELLELATLNPRLRIVHDASEHDMWYMNFWDKPLTDTRQNDATRNFLSNWKRDHLDAQRFTARIFNDPDYVNDNVRKTDFYTSVFNLAAIVQNSEIRHQLSLYDLFDADDIYSIWEYNNIRWFMEYGANELNGGKQPFTQRNLLGQIIAEADSCIALPRPGATLRFGHETMVLPLTCLLNLNGYGEKMHPKDLIKNHWHNYRIFPMGCNIQFVFYRANEHDTDVWVKVLLNEEEATLPIPAISGPYYRWDDVRRHYLALIDSFKY